MPRVTLILLAAVLLGGLAGCSDSSAPEHPSPAVSGTVTDADGNPVADAAVVLDLDFVIQSPTFADKPATRIEFSLPESGRVEVRVTDSCDDEVYYTWSDSLAGAGQHSVIWDGTDDDGRQLVEGFCHAHIQVEGREPKRHELAVARNLGDGAGEFASVDCATVRQTWRVAAWTDANGRFRIGGDCWDFGRVMTTTDETGAETGSLVVAPRVRAWAYPADAGYGAPGAWVDFDPLKGAQADVHLP